MGRNWAVDLADGAGRELVNPPGYSEHYRDDSVRRYARRLAWWCTDVWNTIMRPTVDS